jgi:hypothetical protein
MSTPQMASTKPVIASPLNLSRMVGAVAACGGGAIGPQFVPSHHRWTPLPSLYQPAGACEETSSLMTLKIYPRQSLGNYCAAMKMLSSVKEPCVVPIGTSYTAVPVTFPPTGTSAAPVIAFGVTANA